MMRNASAFLALRYLKPKRSLLSVITFLSVLGPILGVAVLIIVLAVMAGFNRDIREKILGMQAHIQLRPHMGRPIADTDAALTALNDIGVRAAPVVDGPVLIQTSQRILAKYVKGIVPDLEKHVTDIHRSMVGGTFDIAEDEVLIGKELAFQCGLDIGDRFLIHSPEKLNRMVQFGEDGAMVESSSSEVYVPEEVTVAGVFSLGMFEYDSEIIVLHLDKADELFGLEWGVATSIQVCADDPFDLDPAVAKIREHPDLKALFPVTWQHSNKRLFGALQVEKNLMFFLLIFIMIVAAFGIAATLITVVIQKTREIGILKALGATPFTIMGIFVLKGSVVGVTGTILGVALGLAVVDRRNAIAGILATVTGTEIFPKDLYHLSQIPALVQTSDVLIITGSAMIICVLGALMPAIYAASLTPARALHNEV